MWARKTFVHTSLKDLQLPAEQVMMVTGHRSEIQMRNDYRVIQSIKWEVIKHGMRGGPLLMPMSGPVLPSKSSASSPATSAEFPPPLSRFMRSSLITSSGQGSDLAAGLEKKIDDTKITVEEVKEELAEVKDRLQYTTGLLEAVYRRDGMRRHNSLGLPTPPKKRQRIQVPPTGHKRRRKTL